MGTQLRILECLNRLPNSSQLAITLARIKGAYKRDDNPWIVGYSGGKDSTAVLKLVFQSLLRMSQHHKPVTVLYCDTGVEIPLASLLARKALAGLEREAKSLRIPIEARIVSPPLEERFFVKVIGRGYPPPTDKFRWCTDRLRIDPVTKFLQTEEMKHPVVVLGVREAESATRRLTLQENSTENRFWRKQKGLASRSLFMPILDYSVEDVWRVNLLVDRPRSLRAKEVASLYEGASSECPTVREVKGAPCGKARFGCWTCTVAKKGVTLRNLIANGEEQLRPLLRFRLWLESGRNDPKNRWTQRRNGQPGLGPMTITWRRLALKRLLQAQLESGLALITHEEVLAIKEEWEADDEERVG
jgi:DNA sulfur modification protein DndC